MRKSLVVLGTVLTGGLALLVRRRRKATAGGRRPDDGGTAGVREPRRPLPTDPQLVGAAAERD
ncbi:LPXTG cell wall anchor domain-containing protein [Nakamurella sp. YIM 132087]|uniref:LPXTG cell wall anchor domain-containing protein n=1 Tax=Nakamurella alba TaxID=2665158 RepID=A0A7K1FKZ0_9ACTN|nr:LPXTG cell wall anchor domain-containing protein [Nakamurella alba]MTD13544.1 LPXTG cell wall anchor domain-containing protein [Nakamurella alba]